MSTDAVPPPVLTAAPPPVAAVAHAGGDEVPALRSVAAHLRLWCVVGLGLVLDLWSKEWAFHTLRQGGHRVLIPNVLEFHTTLNPGALFGIGKGKTELFLVASVLARVLVIWMFAQCPRRRWLTQIALGAILAGALGNMYDRAFVVLVEFGLPTAQGTVARYYTTTESPDGSWILLHEYPATAEQTPRRISKAYSDRLSPPIGYVRDFIKIPTRWLGGRELWPWVFNVADALLVVGVGILAVRLLLDRKAHAAVGEPKLDAGAASP